MCFISPKISLTVLGFKNEIKLLSVSVKEESLQFDFIDLLWGLYENTYQGSARYTAHSKCLAYGNKFYCNDKDFSPYNNHYYFLPDQMDDSFKFAVDFQKP